MHPCTLFTLNNNILMLKYYTIHRFVSFYYYIYIIIIIIVYISVHINVRKEENKQAY